LSLPVEDDSFDVLCGKAGEFAADLVLLPFPDAVRSRVSGLSGSITQRTATWFCGKSDGGPPGIEERVDRSYPRIREVDECERALRAAEDPDALPESCREAEAAWERSSPGSDGGCRNECGPSGAYARRARLARKECAPGEDGMPYTAYSWREQSVRVHLLLQEGRWVELDRSPQGPSRLVGPTKGSTVHPCGSSNALYSRRWSMSGPLCEESWVPTSGATEDFVVIVEVQEVFGCQRNETVSIEPDDDGTEDAAARREAQSGRTHSPQRIETGVALGDEDFLLRVVALAPPSDGAGSGARVAGWGREVKSPISGVPRIGVAQSEYFYDGAASRDEWMWNMVWRARLVRVTWPESSSTSGSDVSAEGLQRACEGRSGDGSSSCAPAVGGLKGVLGWMVH
jgi:hypothetical protein